MGQIMGEGKIGDGHEIGIQNIYDWMMAGNGTTPQGSMGKGMATARNMDNNIK